MQFLAGRYSRGKGAMLTYTEEGHNYSVLFTKTKINYRTYYHYSANKSVIPNIPARSGWRRLKVTGPIYKLLRAASANQVERLRKNDFGESSK